VADLEIFQHPLSKWGHNKTPFVVTTSQIDPGGLVQIQLPAQIDYLGGTTVSRIACRKALFNAD